MIKKLRLEINHEERTLRGRGEGVPAKRVLACIRGGGSAASVSTS